MLDRPDWSPERRGSSPGEGLPAWLSLAELKRFGRRFGRLVATIVAATLALTWLYLAGVTPVYEARSQLLIESKLPTSFIERISEAIVALDTPQVESQLAILRSEQIAELVVRKLGLVDDPELQGRVAAWSLVARAPAPAPAPTPAPVAATPAAPPRDGAAPAAAPVAPRDDAAAPAEDAESAAKLRRAVAGLQARTEIRRVGLSYAIDIVYSSTDAEKAARIANAIADAYVEDRLLTRANAARQGSLWLEERISDIRRLMNTAALDVQEFRARRDYRIVGRGDRPGPTEGEAPRRGGPAGVALGQQAPPTKDGKDPYTLEELEATAHTYRKIYESYLQGYAESVQRQSYPVTNDRVLSRATTPLTKSRPKRMLTLVAAGILSTLAGLGVALVLTAFDVTLRSARQARTELGLDVLGRIARLETAADAGSALQRLASRVRSMLSGAPPPLRTSAATEVVDRPYSAFSESLKLARSAINLATMPSPIRSLGVVSTLPGEGKSTVAANLAQLYATSGTRTLIVDADVRNPTVSRHFAPDTRQGLVEILNGATDLADCVVAGAEGSPDCLPCVAEPGGGRIDDLLASERMRQLLAEIGERYDLVIIDMPPVDLVAGGLGLCPALDGIVIVCEAGMTPLPAISELTYKLRRARATLLGLLLTKVDGARDTGYAASLRDTAYAV